MRLSDLMKNKGRVSSSVPQGVTTADKQDGPSQNPVEEKTLDSAPDSSAWTHPTRATPDKTEKLSPDSGKPQQQEDKIESVPPYAFPLEAKSTEDKSMYDIKPSGIYRAAEQLKIPIPQSKEFALQSVMMSVSEIITKAVDPTFEKEGLWKTTRKIANDLLVNIALDSNFVDITRIYTYTSKEELLIFHSINTAIIAIDLAKNIDKAEHLPQEIGAAALLHDLGIAALGLDLTLDKEAPVFRKHVEKSVEILKDMKVPEIIRTIVAQHHERLDGHGYPAGISGNEFLVSSQILSLSDGFERIMCRAYQDNLSKDAPGQDYIHATLAEFREAVNPDILKAFISLRGFYPNGTMVELTNRSICRIIKQNEGFPIRPVVQIVMDSAGNHPESARIIDLRTTTTLSIIRSISQS